MKPAGRDWIRNMLGGIAARQPQRKEPRKTGLRSTFRGNKRAYCQNRNPAKGLRVMRAFSRNRPSPLLGPVRRQKLRTDPTLQAGVFDLDPIPLSAFSRELGALGGSSNNGRVS